MLFSFDGEHDDNCNFSIGRIIILSVLPFFD
jgi:hypothetical protein